MADLEEIRNWTPAAQDRALEILKEKEGSKWRPFYCPLPGCDGKPHEDWTWPHGRADQHPPKGVTWLTWLIRGGRGSGKTRTGSEWMHRMTKIAPRMALISQTLPDARETMIEGDSGLLATARPGEYPTYEPSKRKLTWPNGARASIFTAEEPDRLRGPQHHCFVAGTSIQSVNGPVSIEDVEVGDLVWTRQGLCPVLRVGSRPAFVVENLGLTGTPGHPVWTENRGWVGLSSVQPNDILNVWTGEKTSADVTTATRTARSYTGIAGPGSKQTAPYLTDGKFTTSIASEVMTGSRTSSPYRRKITSLFTETSQRWLSVVTAARSSRDAASVSPALDATPVSQSAIGGTSNAAIGIAPRTLAHACSVALRSSLARVVSALLPASTVGESRTVYNLTVGGAPEFVANGILVHNCVWADEPAHMANIEEVWSNMLFGLRLGKAPKICATTTPKPTDWMKDLIKDPMTVSVVASTYANIHNLAPVFAAEVLSKYEGTRLGRQEIHGEVLADTEGALWSYEIIEGNKLASLDEAPEFERVVVAVDPAGTSRKRSNKTGIIVVGVSEGHYYVIADYSGRYGPAEWGAAVIRAYVTHKADVVVAEINYGGEMVEQIVNHAAKDAREIVRYSPVTSRRGKVLRADPVVALTERGKVHILDGLQDLKDQLVSWVPPEESPDRLDAMVHGIVELAHIVEPSAIAIPKQRKTWALPPQYGDVVAISDYRNIVRAG